jgi:DNA-binding XRE family transcriptional regulator
MSKPQIIKDTSGEPAFVVLPIAEYEDLVLATRAADVRAKLETGDEELIPGPVADRLMNGENPVLVYREFRNMTQGELAKLSNVSQPMIAKVEKEMCGTYKTRKAVADALGVLVEDLED